MNATPAWEGPYWVRDSSRDMRSWVLPFSSQFQALCSEAAVMLAPGGLIALETAGGKQADLVADKLRAARVPAPYSSHVGSTNCRNGSSGSSSTTTNDGAAGATPGQLMGEGNSENRTRAEDSGDEDMTSCGGAVLAYGSETIMTGAAFEEVEVLEDCYGVRRFVRAYRRGGDYCNSVR
ncbi:hypothetical protein Vretimale_8358 [Volvox reticuliferus]|uniref:Uncharacterized protein n=1 Tax=Volvox reticuliferus TaxID=1737510 RepID=A0A8J4CGZ6_9CHLO|nr:hypothetical protein Vretifemale_11773 [Volvox reticuliferus]GIM03689.1 hypothetical protein Vretimale_8358 [Volvox reticuliferus]